MRLGLLGGTFDPVHLGHLMMARAAADAARLDRVLLVPCALPPHKERPDLSDGHHRFAMAALLIEESPLIGVSPIELTRGGVSYTVETLREMQAARPGAEIHLIMGSDSFAELTSWRSWEEILTRAAILVVQRMGLDAEALARQLPSPIASILRTTDAGSPSSNHLPRAEVVPGERVDVSSTEIRSRVREGRGIGGMVPSSVETYIRRQGLYAA